MALSSEMPSTQRSWIQFMAGRGEGGRNEVNLYIMRVYSEPLAMLLTRRRGMSREDADDLVRSFFSDRLARPEFFTRWAESGKPLHLWLWIGVEYRRREERRENHRLHGLELSVNQVDPREPIEVELDRTFARCVVRTALELAREESAAKGQELHLRLLLEHVCGERPYKEIAAELGIELKGASGMVRTAKATVRKAIREVLLRDGIPPERIDAELERLLETLE